MRTKNGYRITRQGNKLIVHDVPIFAECFRQPGLKPDGTPFRFDGNFDAVWLRRAAKKAMMRFAHDGYKGPLHIGHHEKSPFGNGEKPKPAGTFKITGTKRMLHEGRAKVTIMADLIFTNWEAKQALLNDELPFRSVEILHVDREPEIDSLALLDHNVPFLRLPNLEVGEITEEQVEQGDSALVGAVPDGTFSDGYEVEALDGLGLMVGCFADHSAAILFEEPRTMATRKKTSKKKAAKKAAKKPAPKTSAEGEEFGAGTGVVFEDDDEGGGEEMEDAGAEVSIADCIKLIKSGKITKADWDELLAAIEEAQLGEDADAPEEEVAAPAAVPGGEAMADDNISAQQFAELQATIITQGKQIAQLTKGSAKKDKVAAALQRLSDRGIPGDLETTLMNFYDTSPEGFDLFVDELDKQNPAPKDDDGETEAATRLAGASELAMQFADDGAGAVEAATGFEEQYSWLSRNTRPSFTCEEFVKDQMARRKARAG